MGIDLILSLLALAAAYFGYQRGLILAIFSSLSVWLGIYLAFSFSALVAGWLGARVSVSDRWLPILAFLLILIGVIILVRLAAKALEGMLEFAQLGTLNRLAGAILYLVLLLGVSSALLKGLQWAQVVTEVDARESIFLIHIQPLFMKGFQLLGQWLPGGNDVFRSLEEFFKRSEAIPAFV